ncbi:MAG: DUF1616 domain-containing protein [Methanospirillum sp.]|nr:DUF1616 domain-containing protein [Methanospirillum sp.]
MTSPPTGNLAREFTESVRPPADVAAAVAWTLLTLLSVYLPVVNQTPLRVALGLPLVLFVPGYLLIAALFPRNDDLDWIERVALSFGLSIAVVPLIGLVLNYTPWGIRLDPILGALSLFVVSMAGLAAYRRLSLPDEERLTIPAVETLAAVRSELFAPGQSRLDRNLSILLVVSIVAALATTVFVVAVPKEGEHFTEFYILGADGKAADYPTAFDGGTPQWVTVGVSNHEYRDVAYTVETHAFNQTFDPATNTSTVDRTVLLDSYAVTIPHNQTDERRVNFTVPDTRFNKVEFLLFAGEVPAETVSGQARVNASSRDLHLWVRVR